MTKTLSAVAGVALDGELEIDEADDFEREGELARVGADGVEGLLGEMLTAGSTQEESPEWMPASSMCCMMPAMTTSSAIAERVDVDFDGVFEEVVDEDGALLRVFDGLAHVAATASAS